MDWANEWWRKFYTRETPEDAMLTWQARAVWPWLIVRCDPLGFLEVTPGQRRVRALASLLRLPDEVVAAGIEDLLDDTRLVELDSGYFLRNFEEAQKARKSPAQRMRETRARRTALLRNATRRDFSSPNRADKSRADTSRYSEPVAADLRSDDQAAGQRAAAAASGRSAKGRAQQRGKVVAVGKKRASPNFSPTTTTPTPTMDQARFIQLWDLERSNTSMGAEHRQLTADLLEGLDAVIANALNRDKENPAYGWEGLRRMVYGALHDPKFHSKRLITLVDENVWRARLDNAFNSMTLDHERAERERKKRTY